MGFFSSVFKGVGKVFSGAAKVVKKVVKGVSSFVKSPGGMMMLALLGGAFIASGGLSGLFGGLSQGTSTFGSFMSKLGTNIGQTFGKGFSNIKGLFGSLKTAGVTISGAGAPGAGLVGAGAISAPGLGATGYSAGVSSMMAGTVSSSGMMALPAGGSFVIPLSTASKVAAKGSFLQTVGKGAAKGLKYKGAASMMQPPQQIAKIEPITLRQPGWGTPAAAGEQIGFSTHRRPGDVSYSDNLVAYVQDAYGAANPLAGFQQDINSYRAFGAPGGANLYPTAWT